MQILLHVKTYDLVYMIKYNLTRHKAITYTFKMEYMKFIIINTYWLLP